MGILVSCCLRLMGYDNLDGSATSKRKQEISSKLSDRDNPCVDGRRLCNPGADTSSRGSDLNSTDAANADGFGGRPDPHRGWSSPSEGMLSSAAVPSNSPMPKGYREDGSKDRVKLKLHLVDSFKRGSK